jgi:probable AcnD-accessory protein PrpF
MRQLRIPAVYMRGGTSKGVFFLASDLPADPQPRDRILLRTIGSPDPYGKQIDGMGGATSSTSKVVVIARSSRPDCDVDYLFGQVAIDAPLIDWSGNCGNLTAAVGPFAISSGLVPAPPDGIVTVRIWQANIGKRIFAHVPMHEGEVAESGSFRLDGVAFPGAPIKLEFLDPGGAGGRAGAAATFPTGRKMELLDIPGHGGIDATLINAGIPTVIIAAESLGLQGTELQPQVNANAALLDLAEKVRAYAAVAMGLATSAAEATARRPHSPKVAFVAKPAGYTAADGTRIDAASINLLARIFSMGKLHHAITGTGAIAIAAAAAIPGTLVHGIAPLSAQGSLRLGHPSGTLCVGAEAVHENGQWVIRNVIVSRSARRLMEGWVRVPLD